MKNNPAALDHPFYGNWVKGYADPHYSEANVLLLNMTNQLTQHYTEPQLQHLTDIFLACSRYELAFWEMAWNMSN